MKKPKQRRPSRRNPIEAALVQNPLFRTRSEPTKLELAAKNNPWNRNAKHRVCFGDIVNAD